VALQWIQFGFHIGKLAENNIFKKIGQWSSCGRGSSMDGPDKIYAME